MKNLCTKFLAYLLCFVLANPVWASEVEFDRLFTKQTGGQSEYFNLNENKRILIRVNFLSGVQRPGVHHVPDDLNLIDAISLAGGLSLNADPEEVHVRRMAKGKTESLKFDLEEIIEDRESKYPPLRDSDVIFIKQKSDFTSSFLVGLQITSALLGIVVTGLLLKEELGSN